MGQKPGPPARARARIDGSRAPEPDGLTDRQLRRDLNAAENAELARLYDNGTISQATRQQLQRSLDLEAARLSEQHQGSLTLEVASSVTSHLRADGPPAAARVLCRPVSARAVSVVQVKVTAEAARRFLLARHYLAPARSLTGGPESVMQVFRKFGSIQFDPVAVAGRNHDLVLHARVADYEPAWCDALYERREIFEATNKALSFVPASEFPWFRHVMGRKGPRFHGAALAENAAVAERVLDRIRAEGPLSSLDFEREASPTKNWFGMPENAVRAARGRSRR